eukprot:358019-Lingulodinium_polyedra.AAC.1
MYGTRDAAAIWGETWAEHLRKNGYSIGKANPAFFHDKLARGFCHGDDFCVLASRRKLEAFEKMLGSEYDIKRVGIVGYGNEEKELQVLDRTVRVVDAGGLVELEADTRHVPRA